MTLRRLESSRALVGLTSLLGVGSLVSTASAADATAPSQPGAITVSGITSTGAFLKWGLSTDNVSIEGYRIYRGPAAATGTALSLIATTDAVNSYTASKLRSGFAYTFGVVAIDAANNTSVRRTATVTTTGSSDTTTPAAPSSTGVALKAFADSRVDVLWAASTSTDVAF